MMAVKRLVNLLFHGPIHATVAGGDVTSMLRLRGSRS
jgi:hypothetical protein